MKLISWNCYVANKTVPGTLAGWAETLNPDLFVLSEARTHGKALRSLRGYTVFQEPLASPPPGIDVSDQADSAILLRNDHVELRHHVSKMTKPWVVTGYDKVHTPRRYENITTKIDGQRWRVQSSHWPTHGFAGPNREAFLESAQRSRRWLRAGVATLTPSLVVGDFNDNKETVAAWFGERYTVAGEGIDLLVGRGIKRVEHAQLAKGGSDHHGQLYRVY